jgi:tetratricopeptide (TPR) repeat protein
LRQYAKAKESYEKASSLWLANANLSKKQRQLGTAIIYHQLGVVAQEQRQWAEAERYYQQALAIYIEFQDRYEQASTYHQLGMVAEEQQRWAESRDYFFRAFSTYKEFQDQHNLSIVQRSLARLWRASGDDTLPAAIATLWDAPEEEVRKLLEQLVDDSASE